MASRRASTLISVAIGAALLMVLLGPGVQANGRTARAVLRDASAAVVGVVRLTEVRGAVQVRAEAAGLEPGFHGFHVHQVGECTPPFTSAGGHFNPDGTDHGDHAGDMPSLLIMEDGTALLRFATDRVTLDELRDTDGSAIIVHSARDNFANIPDRYHSHTYDVFGPDPDTLATGDAGSRVACGVIR